MKPTKKLVTKRHAELTPGQRAERVQAVGLGLKQRGRAKAAGHGVDHPITPAQVGRLHAATARFVERKRPAG